MNKTIYIAALAGAMALGACDEIKEADRYIEETPVTINKAVLVEDFTGQRCTNCPTAHVMIEQMEEQFPEAFIPVSIHAGAQSVSITNTRLPGLATEQGNAYDAAAGVAPHGYPSIIVDGNNSNIYVGTGTEWIDAARQAMAKTSNIAIVCEAWVETDEGGNVCIVVNTTVNPAIDYAGKLQLWIIEDGVVAAQMGVNGQTGLDYTYVHNNVFRAALNGEWGQDVKLDRNVSYQVRNQYPVTTEWEKTWNLRNVKIVGFLYNDSGVEQATRCRLALGSEAALD